MPKKQTIASSKYQAKVGLISKSYKLKKSLADAFKEACDKRGESQASVISRFMAEYIAETNNRIYSQEK